MTIEAKNALLPSLANPEASELESLDFKLQREREWYAEHPRFQNREDIYRAVGRGALVQAHQSQDIRPIARFQKTPEGFDPFLSKPAWRALHDFAALWREVQYDNHGSYHHGFRLAVTSMVRHQEYQDSLVNNGRLAVADSTHCTGNAFDIDASGYYLVGRDGTVVSNVDPRRHAARMAINEELQDKLGSECGTATIHESGYVKSVTDSAIEAARLMHQTEAINLVEEFAGTENACLHIAVNPDY